VVVAEHQSQQQPKSSELNSPARRANRIRDRMGWPRGVLEGSGWGKPKGMHRCTYERLCDKHDTFEHAVNLSFIDRFGPILKKGGF